MTATPPVLVQLSHLPEAFDWARECGNVTKVKPKGGEDHEVIASRCCPIAPMLIANENATACEAAAGVGAYLLVALYALVLTALAPALLVVGGLLYLIGQCSESVKKVGAELLDASYLFPVSLLIAISHIFLTIAAHSSHERME